VHRKVEKKDFVRGVKWGGRVAEKKGELDKERRVVVQLMARRDGEEKRTRDSKREEEGFKIRNYAPRPGAREIGKDATRLKTRKGKTQKK